MDLKQLRALLTIAETGSVTRAADILHTVQPALSRQVKLLEDELGIALFDRERHGMVLTPAGRRFAERVRNAVRELDQAKEDASPRKKQISGEVVVGIPPSVADLIVYSLMERVRVGYPQVQLRSHIAYMEELLLSLERGDVDVALLYLRADSVTRAPLEPLLEDSLFLVGSPDAALDMTTPVALSALNEVPLILPTAPHAVRALVERSCAAAGIKLNVTAEASSMGTQRMLVLQGAGLAILSGSVIGDDLARGRLTACPIAGANLKRTLNVARSPAKPMTPAAEKVLEELRESALDHVRNGRWPGAVLCGAGTGAGTRQGA